MSGILTDAEPTVNLLPDELGKADCQVARTNLSRWCNGCWYIPVRFVLSAMLFCGFFLAYALRVGLSIALVAMVNHTALITNTSTESECPSDLFTNTSESLNDTTHISQDGIYVWDEKVQGFILSSFYYGYVVTQIPGGRLAELIGAKWVMGLGILFTGIFTLVVPFAAQWGPYAVLVVRTLAGLTEGVTYPCFYVMVSIWFPVQEQNTHFAIIGSGSIIGTIVTLPVSAWLCQRTLLGGWPLVFYISGGLSCIWFLIWIVFVSSSPEEHPRISAAEMSYIVSGRRSKNMKNQSMKAPIKKILTSRAVWAVALVKFSTSWLFYVMLTDLPSYLNSMLHFSLDKNGALNSLVYVAHAITGVCTGVFADHVRARPGVSLTVLRKSLQVLGSCGSAICLIFVTAVGCDWLPSYILLLSSCAFLAFSAGGAEPMNMDIAPNHSGTVGGLTNGFANLAGIFGPMLTGFIIEDNETLSAWGHVFWISACMAFGGIIVFLFYGSAEIQDFSCDRHFQLVSEEPAVDPVSEIIAWNEDAY